MGPVSLSTDEGTNSSGSEYGSLISYIEQPDEVPDFAHWALNLGDVQGDGIDDLYLGGTVNRDHYHGPAAPNQTFLMFGNEDRNINFSDMQRLYNTSNYYLRGEDRRLGDVNGDGHTDLVYAWNHAGTGDPHWMMQDIFCIRYGGRDGFVNGTEADLIIDTSPGTDVWGYSRIELTACGDVNGDGFDDLCVLRPGNYYTQPPYNYPERRLLIYFGSSDGLSTVPNQTVVVERSWNWDRFLGGWPGDLNGDGYSDIVFLIGNTIGYDHYPDQYFRKLEVFYGSADGIHNTSRQVLTYLWWDFDDDWVQGDDHIYNSTYVHPCQDINGDGYDDIILEARNSYINYNSKIYERKYEMIMHAYLGSNGTLDSNDTFTKRFLGWGSMSFLVLDLNQDGYKEIMTINRSWNQYLDDEHSEFIENKTDAELRLYINYNGNISEEPNLVHDISDIYDGVFSLRAYDVGDFDGDGLDDVVAQLGLSSWNDGERNRLLFIWGGEILRLISPVEVVGGPIFYTGYRTYSIKVDTGRFWASARPDRFLLTLDPDGANVTVGWDPQALPRIFIEDDPQDLIDLQSTYEDAKYYPETGSYSFDFKIWFNWTWPHEDLCDINVIGRWTDPVPIPTFLHKDAFSVENDLQLVGDIEVTGEWQGPIAQGDWVRSGENLTIGGPLVAYEGTVDVHPPSGVLTTLLQDNEGNIKLGTYVQGALIEMMVVADNSTDLDERFTLALTDLPGESTLVNTLDFGLRVDGTPPVLSNPVPSGDDWQSRYWVLVSITASDDNTSGIDRDGLEYSFSRHGKNEFTPWQDNQLAISRDDDDLTGQTGLDLPDGEDNFLRWRVTDRVGNLVVTEDLRIRVDTMNVSFSDPVPGEDVWISDLSTGCGVTIHDTDGSGIDVGTIQYRVSPQNLSNYGDWMDWNEGSLVDARTVVVRTMVNFSNSHFNYVQWRAADLAGNGLTTSPHYRVKMDLDPIGFRDFFPSHDIVHIDIEVDCRIIVYDLIGGSGVNLSSIEYRIKTTEDDEWLRWDSLFMDGIDFEVNLSAPVRLTHGKDNLVQFRGHDIAGNGPTESEQYKLQCDSKGPEFNSIVLKAIGPSPEFRYRVSFEVHDDFVGVDPGSIEYRTRSIDWSVSNSWSLMDDVIIDGATLSGSINVTMVQGKLNVVDLRALDLIGNIGVGTGPIQWINTPPVAIITSPTNGSMYDDEGWIDLSGSDSYDPDPGNIHHTWMAFNETHPSVPIDLGSGEELRIQLDAGNYTIILTVVDEDGAIAIQSVAITINPAPEPKHHVSEDFPFWILVLMIVSVALVLSTVAIIRLRQREEV